MRYVYLSPNASGTITTVRDKDSPKIIDSTVKSEKYGSCIPVGVGVGVALGEVLLDSITVYSGTTTPNMVTGAVVLISSTASPSVAMIVYDG